MARPKPDSASSKVTEEPTRVLIPSGFTRFWSPLPNHLVDVVLRLFHADTKLLLQTADGIGAISVCFDNRSQEEKKSLLTELVRQYSVFRERVSLLCKIIDSAATHVASDPAQTVDKSMSPSQADGVADYIYSHWTKCINNQNDYVTLSIRMTRHSHFLSLFNHVFSMFTDVNPLTERESSELFISWFSWIREAISAWARNTVLVTIKSKYNRFYDGPGDGNCFFRCIAVKLFNDGEKHSVVRNQSMQWWKENIHGDISGFKWAGIVNTVPADSEVSRMCMDGEYATDFAVAAVAECFHISIHVFIHWIAKLDDPTEVSFIPVRVSHLMKLALINENHYIGLDMSRPVSSNCFNALSKSKKRNRSQMDDSNDQCESPTVSGMSARIPAQPNPVKLDIAEVPQTSLSSVNQGRIFDSNTGRIKCPCKGCNNNRGLGFTSNGLIQHMKAKHNDVIALLNPKESSLIMDTLTEIDYGICDTCKNIWHQSKLDRDGLCKKCRITFASAMSDAIEESLTEAERTSYIDQIKKANRVRMPVFLDIPFCNRRMWSQCFRHTIIMLITAKSEKDQFEALLSYHQLKCVLLKSPRAGRTSKNKANRKMQSRMQRWLLGDRQALWEDAIELTNKWDNARKTKSKAKQAAEQPSPSDEKTPTSNTNDIKRKLKRAAELVRYGQYSKAMSTLNSNGVATPNVDVFNQLLMKHPKRDRPVVIPTIEIGTEDFKQDPCLNDDGLSVLVAVDDTIADYSTLVLDVTTSNIETAVDRAKKDIAGGLSQITPFLIQRAVRYAVGPSLMRAMAMLAKRWTAGHYTKDAGILVGSARLIALFKDRNRKDVRPVAIGDSLRRVLTRAAFDCVSEHMKELLKSHQLGVHKGGYEVGTHAVRYYSEQCRVNNEVILLTDFQNAFNTIDRSLMLQLIAEKIPELLRLVGWLYNSEPELILSNGDSIDSSCGTQQGCLLSNLCFGLVMGYVVDHITPIEGIRKVICYWDDTTLVGTPKAIAQALRVFDNLAVKTGLKLNLNKCHLHCPNLAIKTEVIQSGIIDPNINIHDSFDLCYLKVPIGQPDFVRDKLSDKLQSLKESVDLISKMDDKQAAFILLYFCSGICKVTHICRTVNPEVNSEFMLQFDSMIRGCFESIIDAKLSDAQWSRVQLPVKYGGFGLRSCHLTAAAQYTLSLLKNKNTLEVFANGMDIRAEIDNYTKDRLSKQLNLPNVSTDEIIAIGLSSNSRSDAKSFEQRMESYSLIQLLELQAQKTLFDRLEWKDKVSMDIHAGPDHLWVLAPPYTATTRVLNAREWGTAARLRLGLPVYPFSGPCPACGSRADQYGLHSMMCNRNGSLWIRHEAIKYCLYQFLDEVGLKVRTEKSISNHCGESKTQHRPGDIEVKPTSDCPKPTLIDVSIVHPLGHSKRRELRKSDAGAAIKAESAKINKYTGVFGDQLSQDCIFIPFIMESTGKLGPMARQFLWQVCSNSVFQESALTGSADSDASEAIAKRFRSIVTALSFTLQRQNSAMVEARFPKVSPITDDLPELTRLRIIGDNEANQARCKLAKMVEQGRSDLRNIVKIKVKGNSSSLPKIPIVHPISWPAGKANSSAVTHQSSLDHWIKKVSDPPDTGQHSSLICADDSVRETDTHSVAIPESLLSDGESSHPTLISPVSSIGCQMNSVSQSNPS